MKLRGGNSATFHGFISKCNGDSRDYHLQFTIQILLLSITVFTKLIKSRM